MIQWYPGHMAKALREIEANLKLVDLVLVLVDARIPASSLNPELLKIINNKATLYVLTKADKADATRTKVWCQQLGALNKKAIAINAKDQKSKTLILKAVDELMKPWHEKNASKGLRKRSVRTMVVGNPNVGKSTIINLLAGRRAASVGDKPGVTKSQQWIKVGDVLELLDTPGVLWPKFDDQTIGFNLALTGAIKDEVVPMEDLISYAIELVQKLNPGILEARYGITETDPKTFIDALAKLKKTTDLNKIYHLILSDYRSGALGNITLEDANG